MTYRQRIEAIQDDYERETGQRPGFGDATVIADQQADAEYHRRAGDAHADERTTRYDYGRQVWTDPSGAVLPCAHPSTMGPECCNAYRLTGRRQTERGIPVTAEPGSLADRLLENHEHAGLPGFTVDGCPDCAHA